MPQSNTLTVLWLCQQGKRCLNKERPGLHPEYAECKTCVEQPKPSERQAKAQARRRVA